VIARRAVRGRRASWPDAASPSRTDPGRSVVRASFGAMMEVELVTDGRLTLVVGALHTAG
jgi:D-Tyr-tRNAtyr deacylase